MRSILPSFRLPSKRRRKSCPLVQSSHPYKLPHDILRIILSHVCDLPPWHSSIVDRKAFFYPEIPQRKFLPLLIVCKEWYFSGISLLYASPYLPSAIALGHLSRTVSLRPDLADLVHTIMLWPGYRTVYKLETKPRSFGARALDVLRSEVGRQQRAEQRMTNDFHSIIGACRNITSISLPPLFNIFPLASNRHLPCNTVHLRRLSLCGEGPQDRAGPLTFAVRGRCLSSTSTTVIELDLRDLEELNLSDPDVITDWDLPPLPPLHTLRMMYTSLPSPGGMRPMPLFSEQHNLKVIELRLLDMPTDMPDLSPCIQCIQSNAGTLVELTLLGPAELYIAGHLDYRKFSALQRLNIGYIEGEEFPFEPASLPDSLKVLTVHWSDEHSPYTGKLGYFFRSSRLMLEHLNDTEAFHTIMAPGGVVVMETLGKDSSDLHTFSEEWNIQLLLELDSEARDPVHLGHIKGVPFTSTLTVAFLPFEWAIVRITPSRVRYLTMV